MFAEHNWHDFEAHQRMVRSVDFMYIENNRNKFPQLGPLDAINSDSYASLIEKLNSVEISDILKDEEILYTVYSIFQGGTILKPHRDPSLYQFPYKRIQIPIIIPEVGKCTMKWINGDKIIWEEGVPQVCNVMYDVHEASNLSNKDMIMLFIDVKTDTIVEL